jgi:hypothetical protein
MYWWELFDCLVIIISNYEWIFIIFVGMVAITKLNI